MRIVLDTNCLLASLSRRGAYFNVWRGLQEGKYTLCVSNEILEEYEEIIAQKTSSVIASNVVLAAVLVVLFTVVSNYTVRRKINKIDMVENLKNVE